MSNTGIRHGLSGYTLKLIAVVTMLIDHIAYCFYPLLDRGLYHAMRHVGRIAFPLFCFLLVEGLRHTRSRLKYLRNLAVFALISELPSDLAFRSWQNRGAGMSIFATLTLGLLVLAAAEAFEAECRKRDYGAVPAVLFFLAASCAAIGVAELLHVEYRKWGVGLILMIGLSERLAEILPVRTGERAIPLWRSIAASAAVLVWLAAYDLAAHRLIESYGVASLAPILLYNGERGSYRLPKWFFYVFYPAHLCVLLLAIYLSNKI